MTTKHTPGPWRIARHDTLKDVRHIDAGPAGYERSTVAILDGPKSDANAQLIAAAPELLAALIECAEQLDAETLGGEALDNARAAIAKAKGEA